MGWTTDTIKIRFAGENTLADPASLTIDSGQCVSALNCDIDDDGNAVSRKGFNRINSTATRSLFGSYCIQANKLCSFDGTTATPLSNTTLGETHMEMVNAMLIFSDGVNIGTVEGGNVNFINNTTDWSALAADMNAWVAAHSSDEVGAGVFTSDAFKLPTLAGKFLTFYDGAIYLAIANFVYKTKAFNVEVMDIRYSVVAGFSGAITALRATSDGLYVGTSNSVYFLSGTGFIMGADGSSQGGFTQTKIDDWGIIEGTAISLPAVSIPALKLSSGQVVLWASTEGVMAGLPGGQVSNLSANATNLPNAIKGAAYHNGSLGQYVVCFDTADTVFDANNRLIPSSLSGTYVINLSNLMHSHYSGYPFNSFTKIGSNYYGANKLGVFTLTGKLDFGSVTGLVRLIPAETLSLVTDFGEQKQKNIPSVYINSRAEGTMLVDIYVDELLVGENFPIVHDGNDGLHLRRCKLPKGIRGTNWQFAIKNQDGQAFTIERLEPVLVKSTGRISR